MANAKTGIWSALGALAGAAAGAAAGRYAVKMRPRSRYARPRSTDVEDAMVIGGSTGAVLGAFLAGATMGEEPPPQLASTTTLKTP
jgi:outer membrane lipoprotein SlyB